MGVKGAGWATVLSQFIVWMIFLYKFIIREEMMSLHLQEFKFDWKITKRIFQFGFPAAIESALFSVFAMVIAKMVAVYGAVAIAVQSIGSQIEALSWLSSRGLSSALCSFIGQNYGAGQFRRLKTGYRYTMIIGGILGITVSMLFLILGEEIFRLFLSDPESVRLGYLYLKILAVSQVFMIFEITSQGAFYGIGKSIPPSLTGVLFTGLRIPIAFVMSSVLSLGLSGIWWTISLTSVIKGIVLPAWLLTVFKKIKMK
jgi:putative MATE family efflux protein